MCEHIPKEITPCGPKEIIKECDCGELCEFVCATCREPLCEACREKHEHPVSVGTAGAYCTACKKEVPIDTMKEFYDSLPPFLPNNEKGIGLFFKHKTPKKVIVLAGAGISTAAGIPDFRTPGTGLYYNMEKFNLPYPEAVFTLEYFDENPQPFFTLATELMPGLGKYFPTITHYFISFLVEKGLVLKYFTQNIDGLEVVAGVPMEKLILAHGHYFTGHCRKCKKGYKQEAFFEQCQKGEIAYCKCGGVIKPDIVFFGESLPQEFHDSLDLFNDCDLVITMGTSLTVFPFASLVGFAPRSVPRILLNMTDAGNFYRKTDCKVLKTTDESTMAIADHWGLGDEFRKFLDEKRAQEKHESQ